ncbi:hypothetical protein N7493_001102 [Penicillium malachiteum]|uniref:Uncharacterized protein n=1 Tax=Penicillium malachiteum TaxID=1324776 RepID=A0AAD6HTJ9_9EURO|nr:hypothetical protein N7493_001102 [Penicillium malachiteum]
MEKEMHGHHPESASVERNHPTNRQPESAHYAGSRCPFSKLAGVDWADAASLDIGILVETCHIGVCGSTDWFVVVILMDAIHGVG